MRHNPSFEYTIEESNRVLNHQAQAVEVAVTINYSNGKTMTENFSGVAKVAPEDRADYTFGYELAYWRAIKAAADTALRRLEGEMKHRDDIREIQQLQKVKKKNDKLVNDWKPRIPEKKAPLLADDN